MGECESCDGPRYPDGKVAIVVDRPRVLSILIVEHLGVGGSWGLLSDVEGRRGSVGETDDHEATPSDVARLRVGHSQCEARSDRGIDCIPALAQDLCPDLTR